MDKEEKVVQVVDDVFVLFNYLRRGGLLLEVSIMPERVFLAYGRVRNLILFLLKEDS